MINAKHLSGLTSLCISWSETTMRAERLETAPVMYVPARFPGAVSSGRNPD